MLNAFYALVANDSLFWFCALSGTALFIIQFALTFIGGDSFESGESADPSDFKWLSKQTLTGFLMLFGWVGLTCKKEFHLSGSAASGFAFCGGLLSLIISGFLFKTAKKLRSTGTVFYIDDAIGKEAIVYQRISNGGIGKVSFTIHELTHEIDAISYHTEEIPSFSPVKITQKMDDKTVVVVPIN